MLCRSHLIAIIVVAILVLAVFYAVKQAKKCPPNPTTFFCKTVEKIWKPSPGS